MKMSDVLNVINTRSSIRKFTDRELPADVIRTLAIAGLKAPTATNKQEIHITVVKREDPIQDEIQQDLGRPNFFYQAPITMYLSADESFGWSAVDAGIAVENIHLAASAMGLGSVILGCMKKVLNGEKKAEYAEKLAFPEGYQFYIAIAIGYPDMEMEPHTIDYDKDVPIL